MTQKKIKQKHGASRQKGWTKSSAVGSFWSVVFTQTKLDSSHLESLKPAQEQAEEDLRKDRKKTTEEKVRE